MSFFRVREYYGGFLPTKHFRGVEQFQELSSSLSFIRSEAAVRVSHAQKLQKEDRKYKITFFKLSTASSALHF